MNRLIGIFEKKIFIIAFVIWIILNISGISNIYFVINKEMTTACIKIIHIFFLYFILLKLYSLYSNRNNKKGKLEIVIASVYFFILMFLCILIWPGAWSWDDIDILDGASVYELSAWQNILSGIFHILCLQTIPIATGVIIIQCLIASLIVGYCVSNIIWIYGKNKQQKIVLLIGLFGITLFPTVLLYIFTGFRMGIYSYIELWLISKMLIIYKEKKQIEIQDIIVILLLTIIISCWRTEAFYYPILILILFFILGNQIIRKKIAVIIFIFLIIANYSIVKYNNIKIGTNNYSIMGTMEPVTSLVKIANQEDEEEINAIDKIINTSFVKEHPDMTGENYYWTKGVVKKYSDIEYSNYLKAYVKLALKYPNIVFKSMWNIFWDAASGVGKNSKQTTRNMIHGSGNTLNLYESGDGAEQHWSKINSRFKKTININVRNKVISLLAGVDSQGNITIIHKIFWNLFIPVILISICFIYKLVKKDWYIVFLILTIIIRIPLVFVTAPAPYFMYYLSIYLCSYFISFIIIFEIINDINKKKKLSIKKK